MIKGLLALTTVSVVLLPLTAAAQSLPRTYGYVVDSRGELVRNGYTECWRTGYWSPALAIVECDPSLVKVETPKPAPPVVAAPIVAAPPIAAPQPVAASPAPAPVVLAPPAEPVVTARAAVAVAVPAVLPEPAKAVPKKKIAISGNASFGTGSAALSSAGKAEIDREVMVPLAGLARVDSITVAGHTDPTGNESRNVTLSKARAESVKAYLVSQGVKAEISTEGRGSSVALDGVKCDRKLSRQNLATCFAPLRRIEIDVAGVPK